MNKADLMLTEHPSFRFYSCVFAPYTGTKTYAYKTFDEFTAGDFAIVETPSNGFQVVKVTGEVSISELDTNVHYKWIVSKLDLTAYEKAKQMEQDVAKAIRKAENKQLLKELRESIPDAEEVRKLVRL